MKTVRTIGIFTKLISVFLTLLLIFYIIPSTVYAEVVGAFSISAEENEGCVTVDSTGPSSDSVQMILSNCVEDQMIQSQFGKLGTTIEIGSTGSVELFLLDEDFAPVCESMQIN